MELPYRSASDTQTAWHTVSTMGVVLMAVCLLRTYLQAAVQPIPGAGQPAVVTFRGALPTVPLPWQLTGQNRFSSLTLPCPAHLEHRAVQPEPGAGQPAVLAPLGVHDGAADEEHEAACRTQRPLARHLLLGALPQREGLVAPAGEEAEEAPGAKLRQAAGEYRWVQEGVGRYRQGQAGAGGGRQRQLRVCLMLHMLLARPSAWQLSPSSLATPSQHELWLSFAARPLLHSLATLAPRKLGTTAPHTTCPTPPYKT